MVVAVGLTLVEPLANVEVNVPGVMAILVAPVDAQLNVLLVPEFTLVGFAVKEVMVGAGPFLESPFDAPPQAASPRQADRASSRAQRFTRGELSSETRIWPLRISRC